MTDWSDPVLGPNNGQPPPPRPPIQPPDPNGWWKDLLALWKPLAIVLAIYYSIEAASYLHASTDLCQFRQSKVRAEWPELDALAVAHKQQEDALYPPDDAPAEEDDRPFDAWLKQSEENSRAWLATCRSMLGY
jgi:hypothetical protein